MPKPEPEVESDGGPVAGRVTALSAALAASAADRSRGDWEEAAGARAQALALEQFALALAERDAADYAVARTALANRGQGRAEDERRDWLLGRAIAGAAVAPLRLAACAADVAELSALIAVHGASDVAADAAVASMLAAGAAAGASHLVEVNLVAGANAELLAQARAHAQRAAAAAKSVAGEETGVEPRPVSGC